jgi:PAS domain S-box-containing protein
LTVSNGRQYRSVVATGPLRQVPAPDVHPALDLSVFRQMADMSNDAFYLCDERGRFLYVNDRSSSSSGYTRDELLGMTVSDINPDFPPERLSAFVRELRTRPIPPFETISRRKNGVIMPIELSVAHLEIDGADYMFGVVRDVSERQQLEATRKSFAQRMLRALEAERQRVARELHDDVGQSVATVGVLLHAIEQTPGSVADEIRPTLAQTRASIRQISEAVARIVRDYHPAELVGLGLEDTLRSHVVQFTQRHGLALELATTSAAGLLDHEQQLHLYRIAQEALANVARHAQARRVAVLLKTQPNELRLVIRDDGVGCDSERAAAGEGLGLVTMRERAELMHATLSFHSTPRHGTELRVVLPLDPERRAAASVPPAIAVPGHGRGAGPYDPTEPPP